MISVKRRKSYSDTHVVQVWLNVFNAELSPKTEVCIVHGRCGRPGLSVLTGLVVSVDVKHWSQLVPNMSTDIRGH